MQKPPIPIPATLLFFPFLIFTTALTSCTPGSPPPTKLTLDLSTTRSASLIPVTAKNPWAYDVLFIENADVSLKFPDGRSYQGHLFCISFERKHGEITNVMMSFTDTDLTETYALASKFAADWGLSTRPIDEWHKAAAAGSWDKVPVHTMDDAKVPARDLQILTSFDFSGHKPYSVIFELTWPK